MSDLERQTDGEFSWSAHPAAERPKQTALAVGVILAIGAMTWWSTASVGWGVLALVVLLVALNRFFLPSRFTITSEGITATYPLMRKRAQWRCVRRFALDDHGGYLSTRAQPSRLDAYRGMHLLFGPGREQRDAAVSRIRAHMARHESDAHGPTLADAHGKAAA